MRGSLKAYNKVNISSQAAEASPHKVVQLLLGGSIDKLLQAKLAIEQNATAKKGELIGRTVEIVAHLQAALDFEQGGEIAQNLSAMYDYMVRRLVDANQNNDVDALLEVIDLLRTVKSGWDAIPVEHHHLKKPA
ncbi:flagellar export chaperone FliS [Ferrimonas balearica]|uniref:flagellar export chaperone FliS n=1 Tax=Ferrimonas balearica TaxID=44012 RepID=UPI001C5599D4|nr:flagellar export chaperone FliS [Ferrimonas balearica]MBY6018234.1 flagellar export chaperone FliS [Halomonas denitrificans]MBW3138146.1 flagellar export chaperone FliS [Ferrimonas balearica]MBW3164299.1 flagellar export chaperone FliS [Ferrimonas balearica]MBY5978903.1 flagellar export chaperone FliS [Ferrimonas balearica]MBY6094574.1 flagellar export chaperone FliS [Ferrimonas balearica]